MLNLFNEIFSKLNIKSEYQIVNVSSKMVYVLGHCGIVLFSDEQMVFKLKGKKTLLISGSDLSIMEMDDSTAIINGNITKTEVI